MGRSPGPVFDCWLTTDLRWSLWTPHHHHPAPLPYTYLRQHAPEEVSVIKHLKIILGLEGILEKVLNQGDARKSVDTPPPPLPSTPTPLASLVVL